MSDSSAPPELRQAYQLLKSGQQQAAGQLLKPYLAQNPRDANGWWLMAHATSQPETIEKCLRYVLKLQPDHVKAQERLERLAMAVEQGNGHGGRSVAQVAAAEADTPSRNASLNAAPVEYPQPSPYAPSSFTGKTPPPGPITIPREPVESVEPDPVMDEDEDADPGEIVPRSVAVAPHKQSAIETAIGFVVLSIALVVLIGLALFLADRQGLVKLSAKQETWRLVTLTQPTFTMNYPQDWDVECLADPSGYPVCGIANHGAFNFVDSYTGQHDFITVTTELASDSLFGLDSLPDRQITFIVRDVPQSSMAYDARSWAKTINERIEQGQRDDIATLDYVFEERTIAGYPAHYYRFIGKSAGDVPVTGQSAAYDVYIPHDGVVLWLTVLANTTTDTPIPSALIEDVINSLTIVPPAP